MNLDKCHNQKDLRLAARKRLPSPIFHYIDGGADAEWTLRRNTSAFDDYELLVIRKNLNYETEKIRV